MDIDFNLDNYNLQDLLTLFQLENNFNIEDLKNAKKIVLQLHPDKSGLDKEYFLPILSAIIPVGTSINNTEIIRIASKETTWKVSRPREK